jgi:hypothetical protein
MSSETWYDARVHVHTENDGPTYLRRGAEAHEAVVTVKEALRDRFAYKDVAEALLEGVIETIAAWQKARPKDPALVRLADDTIALKKRITEHV